MSCVTTQVYNYCGFIVTARHDTDKCEVIAQRTDFPSCIICGDSQAAVHKDIMDFWRDFKRRKK